MQTKPKPPYFLSESTTILESSSDDFYVNAMLDISKEANIFASKIGGNQTEYEKNHASKCKELEDLVIKFIDNKFKKNPVGRPRRTTPPVKSVTWSPSTQALRDQYKASGGRVWLESMLTSQIETYARVEAALKDSNV